MIKDPQQVKVHDYGEAFNVFKSIISNSQAMTK